MFNAQEYLNENGCTCVRPLGKKENRLWLIRRADGTQAVLRRYDGENTLMRALLHVDIPQLPRVYVCGSVDGDTVTQEEYLDGRLLSELLRGTLLNERQTAAVAREICLALDQLHRLGYIHRDVKPENIMLMPDGRVALLDFDAATPVLGNPDTNTRLLGTTGYAAPEQFGFARCDPRADVFALGVLMNVMLTGEHPSVKLAGGRLGRVIARCVETNTDRRYANIQALCRELPKAHPGSACPLCGRVTPGGGCIYCGGPAAVRRKKIPIASIVSVLAALVCVVSAAVCLPVLRREREQAALPEPVSLTEQQMQEGFWYELDEAKIQRAEPLTPLGAYTGEALPYSIPFLFDLDGDGEQEQYYLALVQFWPGSENIFISPSGSHGFEPGGQDNEFLMPAICKKTDDGRYTLVPELAPLLENARIEVYYAGAQPEKDVQGMRLQDAQWGVWQGAVQIVFGYENLGTWLYVCDAQLCGEPVRFCSQISATEMRGD